MGEIGLDSRAAWAPGPGGAAAPSGGLAADAHARMMDMLHAPVLTQALAVAAELGIADRVADRPATVDALALSSGAQPDALYRVLRALAAHGVFREVAPRTFGQTALSDTLRAGAQDSLHHWARMWGLLPQRHGALGALLYSVRTGEPAFWHLYGMNFWSCLSDNPDQAAVLYAAARDMDRLNEAAASAYDFSGVRHLVDIGSGEANVLASILRRYPQMTAVAYDRPEIARKAGHVLAEAGVADRVRPVGGDFFASVPAGGDAYLLSMVLHDWDDARAALILANARRAMGQQGKVVVIDAVLPEDGSHHDGRLRDLIMLAVHGGRERTETQFRALFAQAGLRHAQTLAPGASTGVVVAVPDGPAPPPPQPVQPGQRAAG
jgi:predicted O-methyltransferase YrrM